MFPKTLCASPLIIRVAARWSDPGDQCELQKFGKGVRVQPDVVDALKDITGGRGPDACIDPVGMEAGGAGLQFAYDRVKQALHLETDRGAALRQAMLAVRKGGTLSILGVYGVMDKFPPGVLMNKGMRLRFGGSTSHGSGPVATASHNFS